MALVANELHRQPAKFQSSVCGTAAAYLTLWADNVVARNTAVSDFRLSDLVCVDRPMTLYIQPPPSDSPRFAPVGPADDQSDMPGTHGIPGPRQRRAAQKDRRLLSLDEFPTLGRLDFFTMNLRQMTGYGIKADP